MPTFLVFFCLRWIKVGRLLQCQQKDDRNNFPHTDTICYLSFCDIKPVTPAASRMRSCLRRKFTF